MIKFKKLVFAYLLDLTQLLTAQVLPDSLRINDGPYVFIEGNQLIEKSIVDGAVQSRTLKENAYKTEFDRELSTYTGISKIVALSDVHGQVDLFKQILKSNKIINDDLNWSFGNGHMVIVGDVFDRGDKVTEVLWFLFNLEQKAESAGGGVHYLMGNHEYMALQGDLRYINEKYSIVSQLLGTTYDQLYGRNTVLGRWLRSKPTILQLDKRVFVHGGISSEFLERGLTIELANSIYSQTFDLDRSEVKKNPMFDHFHGSKCPTWYRGYFKDDMSTEEILSLLERMGAEEIIVGHTTQTEVVKLYDGLIYGVDSGLKRGKYGELLFMEGKDYHRLLPEGSKQSFD